MSSIHLPVVLSASAVLQPTEPPPGMQMVPCVLSGVAGPVLENAFDDIPAEPVGGNAASAAIYEPVGGNSACAAATVHTTVKRDGAEVTAVFTEGGLIKNILLDYAGPIGSDSHMKVLNNIVLPLQGLDPTKADLTDTVVYFPDIDKGFSNLTQWAMFFMSKTVRADNFARELKKLTDSVPGRIEIQVKQVYERTAKWKTLVLAPQSALYDFLCEQRGLEVLRARRNENARKFIRASPADAAELLSNAAAPGAAAQHLQAEEPMEVTGVATGFGLDDIRLVVRDENTMSRKLTMVEANKNATALVAASEARMGEKFAHSETKFKQIAHSEAQKAAQECDEERDREIAKLRLEQEARENKMRLEQEARENKMRLEQEARENKMRLEQEARENKMRLEQEEREDKMRLEQEDREKVRDQREKEREKVRDQREKEREKVRDQREKEHNEQIAQLKRQVGANAGGKRQKLQPRFVGGGSAAVPLCEPVGPGANEECRSVNVGRLPHDVIVQITNATGKPSPALERQLKADITVTQNSSNILTRQNIMRILSGKQYNCFQEIKTFNKQCEKTKCKKIDVLMAWVFPGVKRTSGLVLNHETNQTGKMHYYLKVEATNGFA